MVLAVMQSPNLEKTFVARVTYAIHEFKAGKCDHLILLNSVLENYDLLIARDDDLSPRFEHPTPKGKS